MKPGNQYAKNGISDLTSAVDYCVWMLKPGGLCDTALPASHATYRYNRAHKCGEAEVTSGERYTNPYDAGDVAFALDVKYKNLSTFETVHSHTFQFFLGLILLIWYINLVDEAKAISNLLDFVINFPVRSLSGTIARTVRTVGRQFSHSANSFAETAGSIFEEDVESQEDADFGRNVKRTDSGTVTLEREAIRITSIHRTHWFVCVGLIILRIWVLIYMWNVGTAFVLSTHSYPDLLLNSLALSFIMEMPEFIYKFLVSDSMKAKFESAEIAPFKSSLPVSPFTRAFFHKHFWGLILLPIITLFVVRHNDHANTVPVLDALRCACSQTGRFCYMATKYSRSWWDQHWNRSEKLSWTEATPASNVSATVGAMLLQLGSQIGTGMLHTEL